MRERKWRSGERGSRRERKNGKEEEEYEGRAKKRGSEGENI